MYDTSDAMIIVDRSLFGLYQTQANITSKTTRQYLFAMAALLLSRYQQHATMIPSLVHVLYRCEHLALPLAELFESVSTEYDAPIAVGEIIRELAKGSSSGAKDVGNKNVSLFISKLAERVPKAVMPFVATLAAQLGDEVCWHTMSQACVWRGMALVDLPPARCALRALVTSNPQRHRTGHWAFDCSRRLGRRQ
jgi:hypothetical protein